jgi:phosphohistidine phosphatase
MNLYIVRHAEAEKQAESGGDDGRRLTVRGRERTREAAAGMRAMGLRFSAILTSPLARAAETADIIAAAYANDPPPQVLPALSGAVTPADALAALGPFSRREHLLIVGHEPQLSGLVSMLLGGAGDVVHVRMKKGACVAIELPNRFERGAGELHWMMTQRQLRKLRK